jgi:hypothetical protein
LSRRRNSRKSQPETNVVPQEKPEEEKKSEKVQPEEIPESSEPAPQEPVQVEVAEIPSTEGEAAAKKGDLKMIIFGAAVLIFAVIGLISTVVFTIRMIGNLTQQDSKLEEYEWLVTPIVLQDPPEFSSPQELTDSTIITAGVWRLIMNEDTSKYPIDDMNFITVPASDIEVQIKALFGDVNYTHQTVGDSTLMIMYDSDNHTYVFPAVPHVLAYTPDVETVVQVDEETIELTIGYIPPGPVWQGDTEGKSYQPSAEKVMQCTLKADESGNWKIYSLESAEGQPTLPEESTVIPDEEFNDPVAVPEDSDPVISDDGTVVPEESSSEESAA